MTYTVTHSRGDALHTTEADSVEDAYRKALNFTREKRPHVIIISADGVRRAFDEFERAMRAGELDNA